MITPAYLMDWSRPDPMQSFHAMVDDFCDNWADGARKAFYDAFTTKHKGMEMLLAAYSYEDYSGNAFILYRLNGKLYEVHGSHCSCYGLEGQWEPEETSIEALKHRIEAHKARSWGSSFDSEVDEVLARIIADLEDGQ